jgi:hypothetical protein
MNYLNELVEAGFTVTITKHRGIIRGSFGSSVQGSSFGMTGDCADDVIAKAYHRCIERFGSLNRVDIERVVQDDWERHLAGVR